MLLKAVLEGGHCEAIAQGNFWMFFWGGGFAEAKCFIRCSLGILNLSISLVLKVRALI